MLLWARFTGAVSGRLAWSTPGAQAAPPLPDPAALAVDLRAGIERALAAPVAPVYRMARRNRFLGRWLAHGEGYPDWNLRLFDRKEARWSDDLVHEKVLYAVAISGSNDTTGKDCQRYGFRSQPSAYMACKAQAPVLAPVFSGPGNQPSFTADYRNRDNGLIYQENSPKAPGAQASERMDFVHADQANAAELNRILWRDAKGNLPMPKPRHVVFR